MNELMKIFEDFFFALKRLQFVIKKIIKFLLHLKSGQSPTH